MLPADTGSPNYTSAGRGHSRYAGNQAPRLPYYLPSMEVDSGAAPSKTRNRHKLFEACACFAYACLAVNHRACAACDLSLLMLRGEIGLWAWGVVYFFCALPVFAAGDAAFFIIVWGASLMRYEMLCQSPFPMVRFELARGEKILIEPGSMTYCDSTIHFEAKLNRGEGGGLFSAIGRAVTSGQSFFITHVTTEARSAHITLGAPQPGEVHELKLGQEQWVLQDGVFLACDDGVSYNMIRQSRSLSQMFLSASVNHFMMETTGTGSMLITSCGALREIELRGNAIIVDNTHAVAWTTGLRFEPRILWDEVGAGFIYEFSGHGKVIVQSCCRISPGK